MSKIFFTSINGTPTDKSLVAENGWHDMDLKWVVTKDNMGAEVLTFGRTLFAPGGATHAMHTHENAEEVILVLKGKGVSIIGDERESMGVGDVCFIPRGIPHSFINESPTEECEIVFVYGGGANLARAGYNLVK